MIKVIGLFGRRRKNGFVLTLALIVALAFCITPLVVTTTVSQPPQQSSILQTHQVVISTADAATLVNGQIHRNIDGTVATTTDQLYSFMQFESMTMMALALAAVAIFGTTSLSLNRELRRRLRKRGHDLILWSATHWYGTIMKARDLVTRTTSLVAYIWLDVHRQVSAKGDKGRSFSQDVGSGRRSDHGTATSNHSFRPALTLSS